MASSYRIGTTVGNKVTLDTLVPRDPQPAPAHYASYSMLGDGTARGVGWLQCEWRWFAISRDEVTALRSYCAGTSAAVYITTIDIDGDFTGYSATMIWPQIPEPEVGEFFSDFVIQFVELVAAGGTT